MKYLDDFRDPRTADRLLAQIGQTVSRPWKIMEVCGGQTHAIVRNALDRLLPDSIQLVHGPGCPVCVTPTVMIDTAIALAARPGVILTSFGDMFRVPGSRCSLLDARAAGSDIRVLYSPLEAVAMARANPDREIVLFGVGFETTAPATALAIRQAHTQGVYNFSVLSAHVVIPSAMVSLLQNQDHRIDAFLAAGHVCAVSGLDPYYAIAEKFRVPIVVTGFEPVDILSGVLAAIRQLETAACSVENCYRRAVRDDGNGRARELVQQIFEPVDRLWRGLGVIPASGLKIRAAYRDFDAQVKFAVESNEAADTSTCLCGQILQGTLRPTDCPSFGADCTPSHPMGATMVSSEGACAAYFRYARHSLPTPCRETAHE